jgi:hypothetical protein
MSVTAPILRSEWKSTSWTVHTSSDLTQFSLNNLEILKFFSKPVGNEMQGMCRFEKGFEQLLPLFRGLVLLGKPQSLSLIYDVHHAQAFFTFSLVEKQEVVRFLNQIIDLLRKEVRFKEVLEKVIENNRRHQAEQALLQSSLLAVSWD